MLRRFLPSPAMIVALIALFVSMGGVSYGLAAGVIDGREIKNGSITYKDIRPDKLGGGVVKESTLGVVPSSLLSHGSARFAVVNAGGQVVRGRSVSSSARTGPGRYQVIFDADVRGCAYFATVGSPTAVGPPPNNGISVGSLASNVNGVSVVTDAGGNNRPENRPFHLIVSC
jgi:hypothetical protein